MSEPAPEAEYPPGMDYERWVDVPGYEGVYAISDHGRVRRLIGGPGTWAGRIIGAGKRGPYPYVNLCLDGLISHNLRIHLLVADAFLPDKPTPLHEINHRDGDKRNNHWTNLEWATRQENILHAVRTGLMPPTGVQGQDHPDAILTDDQAREVYALRGTMTQVAIAAQYGIDPSTVNCIHMGRNWRHLGLVPATKAWPLGSQHHNSKLTEDQVTQIRALLIEGSLYQREIAAMFGVTQTLISSIYRGKHRKQEATS